MHDTQFQAFHPKVYSTVVLNDILTLWLLRAKAETKLTKSETKYNW